MLRIASSIELDRLQRFKGVTSRGGRCHRLRLNEPGIVSLRTFLSIGSGDSILFSCNYLVDIV